MIDSFNFRTHPICTGPRKFMDNSISIFNETVQFVRHLSYRANENKKYLTTLFTDRCGTCSTKPALLKQLADENDFPNL